MFSRTIRLNEILMAGIAGVISKFGTDLSNGVIKRMTDLIRHRGPDDEGFVFYKDHTVVVAGGEDTPIEVWKSVGMNIPQTDISNLSNHFSSVALGHRHNYLQDWSPAGHQPMSYSNGQYWIVFNGRIYNHLEIRSELTQSGYSFNSGTDTETVLAAYVAWGEECQNRFVGMWSFAIFDTFKRELFLSRDRFGIKPLYYYFSQENDFYFASEIKQFTVVPGWQAEMNPQRVYDQLVYSYTDHTEETMFNRVFQLPGGCSFHCLIDNLIPDSGGKLDFRKWYKLSDSRFNGSFKEAVSIFKSYFIQSVEEQFNGAEKIGASLSGGLDSSSIVCTINEILQSKNISSAPMTFSSCTVHERYSEKKWMDIILAHSNARPFFIYPDPEILFDLTSDLIWIHDEPYQSQSVFLGYHVYKLAHENGIKIMLNGQGADEYLGGYGQFTAARYIDMMRRGEIKSMVMGIKQYSNYNSIPIYAVYQDIIKQLLHGPFLKWFKKYQLRSQGLPGIINTSELGLIPRHPFDDIPVKYRSVPEISQHLTFYSSLPKYLKWEDRNSMAHSIEVRIPFLDHRLFEFAISLPDNYLKNNGLTKYVMREAMKGLLPEKVRLRKDKMGFATPEEIWLKRDFTARFRKKAEEAVECSGGILKPSTLDYFDEIVEGKRPFDTGYWRIILLGEWIRRFNIVK